MRVRVRVRVRVRERKRERVRLRLRLRLRVRLPHARHLVVEAAEVQRGVVSLRETPRLVLPVAAGEEGVLRQAVVQLHAWVDSRPGGCGRAEPASAAQAADWPRLAGAWGSQRRAPTLREASGEPAG